MKKIVVFIGMIAAVGVLYACGGGSDSKSTTDGAGAAITTTVPAPLITTPTAISTSDGAAKAVNASMALSSSFVSSASFPSAGDLVSKPAEDQAVSSLRIIATVRDLQQRVSGIIERPNSLGKQVASVVPPVNCSDGGTLSYIEPSDLTASTVYTYAACKMDNEYLNGTVTMPAAVKGQTSGAGITLKVDLTTIEYAPGGGYATKVSESKQYYVMTIDSFDTVAGNAIFKINGSGSEIDYVSGTSNKLSFVDFKFNISESVAGTNTTTAVSMDGGVSMDSFGDTVFTTLNTASGMSFESLRLVNEVITADNASYLTINGKYAIKTIPACIDGTFNIATQIPIKTDTGSGITASGKMTLNNVNITFGLGGEITDSIGNTPRSYSDSATSCHLSF